VLQPDPETRPAASVREIDAAHPPKRKGSGFELEVVKVLQGYAIEAVKIPLSGSVAGFAGDIGAVLTRQDILTNLQCGHQDGAGQGPREEIDEHSKKRSGP
jgi:hypothetical protein